MGIDTDAFRQALIHEIEDVFADVERGDGVTLHQAEVIDDYGSEAEAMAARTLDMDTHWQDVPDLLIERHSSILSFLDEQGLHYYLPAYMRWTLRHLRVSDSMSCDHTIYTLAIGRPPVNRDWSLSRYAVFNVRESRTICRFLRFMATCSDGFADEDVAAEALEDYWAQFCDNISQPGAAADGPTAARR